MRSIRHDRHHTTTGVRRVIALLVATACKFGRACRAIELALEVGGIPEHERTALLAKRDAARAAIADFGAALEKEQPCQ
jgi:hypothetical protein